MAEIECFVCPAKFDTLERANKHVTEHFINMGRILAAPEKVVIKGLLSNQ